MIEKPLEIDLWKNYPTILGMDEAGRGPIAGPLVVAGVVFPKGYENARIDDSKKISEKKREALYEQILNDALFYKILVVSEQTIDELNIYRATQRAMEQIAQEVETTYILTDAMPLKQSEAPFEAIVKGDQKSISIAAASIIAKVTRDRLMVKYNEVFPEYGFASNKGYGAKAHLDALKKYGPTPIHRHSFLKNMEGIV